MSVMHDEFTETVQKQPCRDPLDSPPASRTAVISLVFGIFSFCLLPVVGAIVAVVLGTQALREIRESGGRIGGKGYARSGLILGCFNLALALFLGLAFTMVFAVRTQDVPARYETRVLTTEIATPAPAIDERGVKMANELGNRDFALLRQAKLDQKPEEIVAFYNASTEPSEPELALLTTEKILYVKEGRKTEYDLKEVAAIKGANELGARTDFRGNHTFPIEVVRSNGTRMRILISPQSEGMSFFDALTTAWKASQKAEK